MVSLIDGAATVYIGEVFEWDVTSGSMRRYYYAGAQRVATRTGSAAPVWLLGDHLGSASVAADADGSPLSRQGYLPWGERRYSEGSLPGRYKFTGQASYEAEFGLYYFKARWYDPYLTQFTQPDSIIPDPYNPLDWNRYAYTRYNLLKYSDPTGHWPDWLGNAIDFAQGATYQFVDDMTLGTLNRVAISLSLCMDCNRSDAYQQGQEAGRAVSTVVSSTEAVLGTAAAAEGLAAMGPTAGGGLLCGALTAGGCFVVAGVGLTVEGAMVVGGVAVAGHGVGAAAYIKNSPIGMLGKNGPQFTSKTIWRDKHGRLDVENPSPGKRPGQIHFQQGNNKWIYDPTTNSFRPAKGTTIDPPNWLNDLLGQKEFQNAIQKALYYLEN